jgi:hypothetical protein
LDNSFVYLGIPQFVLDWRPSVPGPKMGAFLTVSLSLTGLYIYDRKETARIQKEYCDKVRWMSEQNLDTHDKARKIRVYGARVPEDGELERGAKWFKRYMRVRSSFLPLPRLKEPFFSFFPSFFLSHNEVEKPFRSVPTHLSCFLFKSDRRRRLADGRRQLEDHWKGGSTI